MLRTIRHLLELIRFSHTVFALPFALLAAMMAWRMNAIDLEAGLRSSPYVDALLSSPNVFVHDTYLTIGGRRYDVAWDGRFAVRWQEVVGVLLCMVAARSAVRVQSSTGMKL